MSFNFKTLFCFFISTALPCKANTEDHFLIVANGPFEEEVVRRLEPETTIIALDGAASKLYNVHITPNYVLGDFDSLQEVCNLDYGDCFNFGAVNEYFTSVPKPEDSNLVFEECTITYASEGHTKQVTFVRAYCQNYSDLEKAIRFCASKNAKSITITGALGGERTDHSFANLSILKKYHSHSYKIKLETHGEIIEFLKDETVKFKGTIGAKFGLFGFPKAEANSQGLVWDLDHYNLELGVQESSCNILKDSNVNITIQGEALMIRPNY